MPWRAQPGLACACAVRHVATSKASLALHQIALAQLAAGCGGEAWVEEPARQALGRARCIRSDGRRWLRSTYPSADRYSRLIHKGFWPLALAWCAAVSYEFRSNLAAEGLHHHIAWVLLARRGAGRAGAAPPRRGSPAAPCRPGRWRRPPTDARSGRARPARPPGASTRRCRHGCL